MKNKSNQLRNFYILWSTQSLSHLGSSITSFALTLWLYEKTGSALGTAALTICTYAPHGAGICAVSDKRAFRMASVRNQCIFRADEYSSAAGIGGNLHAGYPEKVRSENERSAIVVPIPDINR